MTARVTLTGLLAVLALLLGAGAAAAHDATSGHVHFTFLGGGCGTQCPDEPTGHAEPGPGDGQITLHWTPATTGGSPTSWTAGTRRAGTGGGFASISISSASTSSYVISGLESGVAYDVRLAGSNTSGSGDVAQATNVMAGGVSLASAQIKTNRFGISDRVVLTFKEALNPNSKPSATAFQAISEYAGIRHHISSAQQVTISGKTVTVTLGLPLRVSAAFRVTYTKPSSNPLRTTGGAEIASFTWDKRNPPSTSDYRIECSDYGYWYVTNKYGFGHGDRSIACDMAKPGWVYDDRTSQHGDIRWSYAGDPPGTTATNPPPPVNQPVEDVFYAVPDHPNHRVVEGTDGNYYREERVRSRWQRSISYGSDAAAGRNASWNAYNRSQGRALVNPRSSLFEPAGTFPSGAPPARSEVESVAVDGKTLTLTFNENLDPGSLPSRWAFYVTVNNARRSVASGGVAIDGQTVRLTLASAVTHLDAVRVRYTRPSVRPLRGGTGIAVATFSYSMGINNTPVGIWSATLTAADLVPGVGCSSSVSGKECSISGVLTDNTFTLAGTAYQVTAINVGVTDSGDIRLLFELDKAIPQDLTLHVGNAPFAVADATLSNSDKSAIWSDAFGSLWTANQQVSLRLTTTPLPPPMLQSGVVDGKTLTLTFDATLDPGSLPSRGAFYVTVNGARRSVAAAGVAIAGQTVRLTLASAVTPTDTVRVPPE